ncbi:MAG: formylglycine-generating enzyme family protein [Treponema sp.]|jgi:formylglycine-generating enzyme required for sulfatase activity|nr:formylglycine-generating enzyme family protein [Treponema sp.]
MKKQLLWVLVFGFFVFTGCDTGSAPEGGLGLLINPDYSTREGAGEEDEAVPGSWYERVLRDAAALIAATKISADGGLTDQATGKPVYIGFYWTDPASLAALNEAIAEVKADTDYLLGAGAPPETLDSYAAKIQDALNAFAAARAEGAQPLDWTLLESAWTLVKADYDGRNLDALNSRPDAVLELLDYGADALFKTDATPAAYEAYGATLTEIKEWIDAGKLAAGTITQDEIDARIALVEAAPGIFSASLGRGYWVTVPAGKFQRDDTAANISEITGPYNMGAYEVTQELFMAVMEIARLSGWNNVNSTGAVELLPADGARGGNNSSAGIGLPHVYAFCNRLSYLKGKTPVYSITTSNTGSPSAANVSAFNTGNPLIAYDSIPTECNTITADWSASGYRLPTEMEWMWAAMGANQTADMSGDVNIRGYSKAFAGDDLDNPNDVATDYAWIPANTGAASGNDNRASTRQVGIKLPNELGLYDMSGNLAEFCWDAGGAGSDMASIPSGTLTDFTGITGGSGRRVVMGGDYGGNYVYSIRRSSSQNGTWANYQHAYYGFRIVCKAE